MRWVLVVAVSLCLVACGGDDDSSNPGSSDTRATATLAGSSSQPAVTFISSDDNEFFPLIEAYLQQQGTPYRDIVLAVLSQDEAFATVRASVQLRENSTSDWAEHFGDFSFKKVGENWQLESADDVELENSAEATGAANYKVTQTAQAEDVTQAVQVLIGDYVVDESRSVDTCVPDTFDSKIGLPDIALEELPARVSIEFNLQNKGTIRLIWSNGEELTSSAYAWSREGNAFDLYVENSFYNRPEDFVLEGDTLTIESVCYAPLVATRTR